MVFPQELQPFHVPTGSAQGFQFSTSSPKLVFCLFGNSHPGCEVRSHCAFDLPFSNHCKHFEARGLIPFQRRVGGEGKARLDQSGGQNYS